MTNNPDMSTTDKFERHYRQQLSALVDGELSAEESRFCCGAWPMTKSWPAARSAGSSAAMCCAARQVPRRRWISPPRCALPWPKNRHLPRRPLHALRRAGVGGGAALAASVAAIALFVSRERLPEVAAPAPAPAEQVFATTARLPASTPAPQAPKAPDAPDDVVALAAAVPAAALASARRGAATRNQQVARSVAARNQQAPARMVASAAAPAATPAVASPAAANPFTHPETTLQARPWPRAALAGSGESPLNASFSQSRQAPAFYPFEPAPQAPAAAGRAQPAPPPQD